MTSVGFNLYENRKFCLIFLLDNQTNMKTKKDTLIQSIFLYSSPKVIF